MPTGSTLATTATTIRAFEQRRQQLVEGAVGINREPAVCAGARADLWSVRKLRFAEIA
jgi:hypothetical protein